MGLITLNLKRVLNWNFIFMSAVAAIFGMISLMNFGDISENIVFGVDIKYFMLERLHQNNKEKPGAKLSLLPAFLYLLLYVVD